MMNGLVLDRVTPGLGLSMGCLCITCDGGVFVWGMFISKHEVKVPYNHLILPKPSNSVHPIITYISHANAIYYSLYYF